jgi:hypothetical protein
MTGFFCTKGLEGKKQAEEISGLKEYPALKFFPGGLTGEEKSKKSIVIDLVDRSPK